MKEIFFSLGWSISAIFIISTMVYLIFSKRRNNQYTTKAFNFMISITILVIVMEILSVITISMRNQIPILNEIVCRAYLYIVLIWSFTTFEHLAYNDKRFTKTMLRTVEISVATIGLMLCVFVPIEYTQGVPYAVCGPLTKMISIYIIGGSILETILLSFKILELKDASVTPYITTTLLLLGLLIYEFVTNDFMNIFSAFLTFVATHQYYNNDNQDMALLEKYEVIKAESDLKNKERDEFITNLSREIRAPMSNIMGFSNLVMLEKENLKLDVVTKDGKQIHKEALSLLGIINDILDLSRFEAGKEKKEERNYIYDNLVLDVSKEILKVYKDIKISYKFMENFPNDLYGDNLKIEKLICLICDYITKDRKEINLSIEYAYKKIDTQKLNLIFTFNVTNESISRNIKENKLDFKKQIIDAYNNILDSKIIFIKEDEHNLICSLVIEQKILSDQKVEKLAEKIKLLSYENKQNIDYSDKSILIVDDSQMNINIAKRLFSKYGFKIDEAITGMQCIEMIKTKKYDIVFLDDMMPELSGIQTLGELKNMNIDLPPIVALTANSYNGLKEEYIKNGFTDYLSKPIESDKFEKIINDLLVDKGGEYNVD